MAINGAINGTIIRVFLPRGYGFIRGDDTMEYFLHARDLPDGQWNGDIVHEGVRVKFVPKKTEHGWRAHLVTLVE